MNYYLIAPAKTFHSSDNLLTYESEIKLKIGHIVLVPLGKNTTVGVVVKSTTKPGFDTKPITQLLYDMPLPNRLVKSLFWLHEYYRCPLSSVIQTALPRGIAKKRRTPKTTATITPSDAIQNPLSSAQIKAIQQIEFIAANTILLHGITGSGKTNIYIELTKHVIAQGQSVIILVPEIALTSQIVQNFQRHFANISVIHSEQTEATKHLTWQKILNDPTPQVILGPRSALFAPVQQLGLVIIDEAHEPAYQQDQNPKYNALRLASYMSRTILGTATPLINDFYLCKQHQAVVELSELAIQNNKTTGIQIIDLKNQSNFSRSHLLSNQLITSIQSSLQSKTQSLIFHNRRGTAPLTICDHCGWQALCQNCFLPLVLHSDEFIMRCHTCGHTYPVPTSCPECHNASIHHKGFGTKMLQEELERIFPHAKIARFDADTESDQKLNKIYDQVHAGEYDIIVGTQMIAKGFDFPLLTTLGIAQADAQLSLPDFSSEERTYELINQVVGRAKRGHQNSKIFVQSFQPQNPLIAAAVTGDYATFYKNMLQKRKQSALPPFSFLFKLSYTYKTEKFTIQNIQKLYKKIIQYTKNQQFDQVVISPPMPAFHERTNTGYTWQIVVKAKSRKHLLNIFDNIDKDPHLHFALDPPTLL